MPLAQRWPQGFAQLQKDAVEIGFEPWVPSHSRLFADWTQADFARGPAPWLSAEERALHRDRLGSSYLYVGAKARLAVEDLVAGAAQVSIFVLDARHALASSFKAAPESAPASLLIVNAADAFVDFLASETFIKEWVATEWISPDAQISPRAQLEPGVMVGPGAVIDDGVILRTGVRIGAQAHIGADSDIGAHTVIGDFVEVGEGCAVGPHCALGTPGFGLIRYPQQTRQHQRVHVGSVKVGAGARLGAFVSIDRGVFEDTVVGAANCFDDHVHVGHNSRLGDNNVLCAMVALGGSTDVGSRVTIAGFVGTVGHMSIGNDVVVAAQSGVTRDIRAGEQVKGYPARPLGDALKIATVLGKLPDMYDRLRKLEKKDNT